jgi:pyruvate/2-oxoglutarate dehydrogenase complex dihydrolipoamide acyltransferase (E2) component
MNSVLAPALEQVLSRDPKVAAATARELIEALPNAVIVDRIVDTDALIRLLSECLRVDPLGTLEHLGVLHPAARAKAASKPAAKAASKPAAKAPKPAPKAAKPAPKPAPKPAKAAPKPAKAPKPAAKAGRVSLTTAEVEAIKALATKALKDTSLSRAQLVEAAKIPSEAIWVRVINELVSSRVVKRTGTRRTALYSLRK